MVFKEQNYFVSQRAVERRPLCHLISWSGGGTTRRGTLGGSELENLLLWQSHTFLGSDDTFHGGADSARRRESSQSNELRNVCDCHNKRFSSSDPPRVPRRVVP